MNLAGGSTPIEDPHRASNILMAGASPEHAQKAVVMLHGRGANAEGMLELFRALAVPTLAALAPQASGQSWYPRSFLFPIHENQPYLDSALRCVDRVIESIERSGVTRDRIALLGFSQGACLAGEYLLRTGGRFGAAMLLTGGFAGPPGERRTAKVSLKGTPVFLGAGDPDPHVPFKRVKETAELFEFLGGKVTLRRYPNMPHIVSEEELAICREMLAQVGGVNVIKGVVK